MVFTNGNLDCNFPIRSGADFNVVCGVGNQGFGLRAQFWIIEHKPEQGLCIKQQPHGMYSLKSCRCSSSSARIISLPLALPGSRGCRAALGCATNRATG